MDLFTVGDLNALITAMKVSGKQTITMADIASNLGRLKYERTVRASSSSSLYSELKAVNISSDLKFLYEQVDQLSDKKFHYTAKNLHVIYTEWCMLRKKVPMAENSFAKRLNLEDYASFVTKSKGSGNQYYHLDLEKLELFKSTKNIDYTVVEILDKFPEKYLTKPTPESTPNESTPKKR